MPIQPGSGFGIQGQIHLKKEYVPGLTDLNGFSHIILIYLFHQSEGYALKVTPFLDTEEHGVFATRAPRRPNPIGFSVVKLIGIEDNVLTIENVDMLDGTPVLDIKPYVPDFDQQGSVSIGWLQNKIGNFKDKRSDDRFG